MIIKVCGIKTQENIEQLAILPIQMIGLNFYEPSVRYVSPDVLPDWYDVLPDGISRVGVFVNMPTDDIMDMVDEYRLDYVQLHGDESPVEVQLLSKSVPVIRVARVDDKFDMQSLIPYTAADYILFDKESKCYGGTGQKFDWSILEGYPLDIPFMLSGGIGPDDVSLVKSISHQLFAGIDINSKFESSPGVKDPTLIDSFLASLDASSQA